MKKPAQKTLATLLSVLLTTCWVVGEAWHLVPGMAHLEEFSGGCLVVGTAPENGLPDSQDCGYGKYQSHSSCSLKNLSAAECPICRVLANNRVVIPLKTSAPLSELVQSAAVDQLFSLFSTTTRTIDARGPPA